MVLVLSELTFARHLSGILKHRFCGRIVVKLSSNTGKCIGINTLTRASRPNPQHPRRQVMQAADQQFYALARNDQVTPCELTAESWLLANPRGAYTTARTVGGSSVFELTHHINRLASSVQLMMDADCKEGKPHAQQLRSQFAHLGDPSLLRPLVIASLQTAIAAYRQKDALTAQMLLGRADGSSGAVSLQADRCEARTAGAAGTAAVAAEQPGGAPQRPAKPQGLLVNGVPAAEVASPAAVLPGAAPCPPEPRTQQPGSAPPPAVLPPSPSELKLTVLVTWDVGGADVYAHVSQLPPRPAPPVKVQVRGAPRSNALAKDSEWVRQRQALQDSKPPDVNEVLLVEGDGAILEGMASNFFAVVGGAVHTAGEGVLQGTVRSVALQVAEREGIPVVMRAPNLQEVERWEGAFISSTSRLVLPVDELEAPDWAAGPLLACWPKGGVASRLEQLVLREIAACSEPLS